MNQMSRRPRVRKDFDAAKALPDFVPVYVADPKPGMFYVHVQHGVVRFTGRGSVSVQGFGNINVCKFETIGAKNLECKIPPEKLKSGIVRELADADTMEKIFETIGRGNVWKSLSDKGGKRKAQLEELRSSPNIFDHAKLVCQTYGNPRSDHEKTAGVVDSDVSVLVLERLATEYAFVKGCGIEETVRLFAKTAFEGAKAAARTRSNESIARMAAQPE